MENKSTLFSASGTILLAVMVCVLTRWGRGCPQVWDRAFLGCLLGCFLECVQGCIATGGGISGISGEMMGRAGRAMVAPTRVTS